MPDIKIVDVNTYNQQATIVAISERGRRWIGENLMSVLNNRITVSIEGMEDIEMEARHAGLEVESK